jgi:hypothetical protein
MDRRLRIVAAAGPRRVVALGTRDHAGRELGRVVDTRTGVAYPPASLDTILTRAGWRAWDGDPDPAALLAAVREWREARQP